MQNEAVAEKPAPPQLDGLTALYQFLVAKEAKIITAEDLVQKGFTGQQATMIIEILTLNATHAQRIAYLSDINNKPVIDQEIEYALDRSKSMYKSGNDTMKLVEQLKKSLIKNATGTLAAFNRVIVIYTIAFIIGVGLIATAVVFGAMGKTVLAVSFGAIGLIDIITYFVKLPANKIQESRSNLSQLQVVLLVWLKDFINNEAICSRRLNSANPSIAEYKELAEINIDNTGKLLRFIETMAEPKT